MIIFTGVAGSGKSSQGKMLADKLGLPWLSTGEFLRMLISGQRRKDMLAGLLLDDQEIITLVRKLFTIIDTDNEFILDGFPRTEAQADWLLNQSKHGQLSITAVINMQASENVVAKRLLTRGRQDDTNESIDQRFKEYRQSMLPILQHFQESGVKVIDINAEQTVEEVHEELIDKVQPLLK